MSAGLKRFGLACAVLGLALTSAARAWAEGDIAPAIDGAELGLAWTLPFAGLLGSIAFFPAVAPEWWHRNYGKVAALWALAFLVPALLRLGPAEALHAVLEVALADYVPFIILLFALYVVAGGIRLEVGRQGTPAMNTLVLAAGTLIASVAGTTGAAMLLIRPLIALNAGRRHKAHTMVFFIILVANIGGALSPLGDPPLFLGFLAGVRFFWPTVHLWPIAGLVALMVMVAFFLTDSLLHRREKPPKTPVRAGTWRLQGGINFILLFVIAGGVLLSGLWHPGITLVLFHIPIGVERVVRDILLLTSAGLSWRLTEREVRSENAFTWEPIAEVAKLFAGIFVTILPAIVILRAGREGALAGLINLVSAPDGSPRDYVYFWLTGALSSVLDNAPTYLVFFNAAGADAGHLMGEGARTLAAISAGAVFFGAMTYIGNAPNLMVRSIARERGVAMPGFFGYIAWVSLILLPVFLLVSLIFFPAQ